jgi:hypothetical protein
VAFGRCGSAPGARCGRARRRARSGVAARWVWQAGAGAKAVRKARSLSLAVPWWPSGRCRRRAIAGAKAAEARRLAREAAKGREGREQGAIVSRRLIGGSCSELSPAIACDPRMLRCGVQPDLWLERSGSALCCACPSVPHTDRTTTDCYRRCRSARTVYSQRTCSAGVLPFRHYSNLSWKKTLFDSCVSYALAARCSGPRHRGGRLRRARGAAAPAGFAARGESAGGAGARGLS